MGVGSRGVQRASSSPKSPHRINPWDLTTNLFSPNKPFMFIGFEFGRVPNGSDGFIHIGPKLDHVHFFAQIKKRVFLNHFKMIMFIFFAQLSFFPN